MSEGQLAKVHIAPAPSGVADPGLWTLGSTAEGLAGEEGGEETGHQHHPSYGQAQAGQAGVAVALLLVREEVLKEADTDNHEEAGEEEEDDCADGGQDTRNQGSCHKTPLS